MIERTLVAENLTKRFGGTLALDSASLEFRGGEVHALLGKNGAGKSTLVRILAGASPPDSGRILLDGREIRLASPGQALAHGIAMVYQELSLLPALTVGENILLGHLPRKNLFGSAVDWPAVWKKAGEVLRGVGADLDPRVLAGDLGVSQQQVVEIAKAMSRSPSVLILDEPTSALAAREADHLLGLIRGLAAKGVAVIYISHRLQEVMKVADRISVLRDGRHVGTIDGPTATPATIAHLMFGQALTQPVARVRRTSGTVALEVRHLSRGDRLQDISFSLMEGEVLGIAGMMGSGRTELMRAIFGADPFDSGEVLVQGRAIRRLRPQTMKKNRLAFIPEDRKTQGLVQILSIRDNLSLANHGRISTAGVIRGGRQSGLVRGMIEKLGITAGDHRNPVSSLSGGNQQKVVIGNWLGTEPRIMLFDEPTRGIDVQAKQQVFRAMRDLSAQGIAILFVSTELEEVLEVADRILFMKDGRLTDERDAADLTISELLQLTL